MRLCLFCLNEVVSILPHEAIWLMRQNKIYGFLWAQQDWIVLMIFKSFADHDWIGFNFCESGFDSD